MGRDGDAAILDFPFGIVELRGRSIPTAKPVVCILQVGKDLYLERERHCVCDQLVHLGQSEGRALFSDKGCLATSPGREVEGAHRACKIPYLLFGQLYISLAKVPQGMECDLTCIEGADGSSELTGGYFSTYGENSEFPQSINLCLDHKLILATL